MEESAKLEQCVITVNLNLCELGLLFTAVARLRTEEFTFTYGNDEKLLPPIKCGDVLVRLKKLGDQFCSDSQGGCPIEDIEKWAYIEL